MERDVQSLSQEDGSLCTDNAGGAADLGAVVQTGGSDSLPGGRECDPDSTDLCEELDLLALNPRLRARLERVHEQQRRMDREQREALSQLLPEGRVRFDEPLANHSALGIGGPVEAFVTVEDVHELKRVLTWAEEFSVDYRFFGKGQALIVRDAGLRGMLIRLGEGFATLSVERFDAEMAFVAVGGAVSPEAYDRFVREQGLVVPSALTASAGTLGGLLLVRHWDETSPIEDVVEEVTIVNKEGKELTMRGNGLRLENGQLKVPRTAALIRALLKCRRGTQEEDAAPALVAKQVSGVFAPAGKTAAAILIKEAGLAGVRIGGARISSDDANTIVSEQRATARDIAVLIDLVRDRVKQQTGIVLETLVEFVGEK